MEAVMVWSSRLRGRGGETEVGVLALVVVLLVVTVLLAVVVTGLLRSHADIIRALHSLGVGVGDPAAGHDAGESATAPVPVQISTGPPLPGERKASSSHDIEGVSPDGDAVVVAMDTAPQTLLAFLSSGCASCGHFWSALGDPAQVRALPSGIRIVVVTKGPEWEIPSSVAARAPGGVDVVMSSSAWGDYEVPGSPYFALIDGTRGVRIGEGVANQWSQIADLVHRARDDVRPASGATTGRATALGLNGAERESVNDQQLMAAGVFPGDPSLYPRRLEDVFASTAHLDRGGQGEPQPEGTDG
jgi:hypothetical protein